MSTVFDIDVLLLLATALAAKRRPAELVEIVAAVDLIQGHPPAEEKIGEAFARLGENAWLEAQGDGLRLSQTAEELLEQLSAKADHAQRLFELKALLNARKPNTTGVALSVSAEQWQAALAEHKTQAAASGKNLLMPKPKTEVKQARPGQRQRKPMPKSHKR